MKEKQIQNPWYKYRNFIFIFVIILLTVIVVFANRENIEHALFEVTTASFISIVGLTMMTMAYLVLDAIILKVSIEDDKLGFGKSFIINSAGAFFSGVTPFYVGSYPSRLYYLYKDGIEVEKSLAALTVKGITYQFLVVVLAVAAFFIEGGSLFISGGYLVFFIIGFIWNTATVVALILVSASVKANIIAVRLIQRMAEKIKFVRVRKDDFIEGITNYYAKTRRMYQDWRYFLRVFGYTFVKICVFYAMPIVVFIGLGLPIREYWSQIIAISCLMAIIVSVFPTPGGMAASEAVFLAAFSLIFVSQSTVEASMLIWRLFSYYLIIFIGLIATLVLQSKEPKPIKKRRREKHNGS